MINYAQCIQIKYPGITELDFELREDENGLDLIWNNEATYGPKPSFGALASYELPTRIQEKVIELDTTMYDEITNGTSGYQLQGLNSNFRIDSGRDDLDNMRNLRDYCRQMIVAFTNGAYPANLGGQVTNNHPELNPTGDWYGVISSFAVEYGSWGTGDAQGVAYLNSCKGTLTVGEQIYMCDNDPVRLPVAVPVYFVKNNMMGTVIKGFENNFHPVTLQELDVIIFELQAYGLWLYQHKWEKVAQVMTCTTVEQLEAISFFS
jgi:hypothetical protein